MFRSAIKEIITGEKIRGSEEGLRTTHSGQLNIQAKIHNFYENQYKKKPCNDDHVHVKDFLKGMKTPKVTPEEAMDLVKPNSV